MRPVEAVLITIIVVLLLFIQLNHQQLVVFRLMYERWANECLTILAAAMIRRRNRRRQRIARLPYAWSIPRPGESWFDIHHYDATIPEEFFRQQLRVRRHTFNRILNLLDHRLVRQPSRFRNPLPPEKILALGLYRLGHGNSYVTIGPSFNVGKATAIEAVQDVVRPSITKARRSENSRVYLKLIVFQIDRVSVTSTDSYRCESYCLARVFQNLPAPPKHFGISDVFLFCKVFSQPENLGLHLAMSPDDRFLPQGKESFPKICQVRQTTRKVMLEISKDCKNIVISLQKISC
ncbi:PREDICTED: uncharacterized protein LOC107354688 [Acropora digitifera]|uniref:uncharacterized protein LOC107354688 n=1 Tax=Acropora digitifera TaxID=70779 RepID=UPI00077A1A70|nr:PREDICTED: uncharacterized protein LOC107354688 [Acropora digitifera]